MRSGHPTIEQRPMVSPDVEQIQIRQRERLNEQKEALVQSPELRETILGVAAVRQNFGDPNLAGYDISTLGEYGDFNGARRAMRLAFDFRTRPDGSFGERWEATERVGQYLTPGLTPELEAKIYSASEKFELTGDTAPKDPEADAAAVLGAGGAAPLDRTLYTKELIDDGKLIVPKIVALGSERAIDDAERKRGGEYAQFAQTEFDLMVSAMAVAYNLNPDNEAFRWLDPSVYRDYPDAIDLEYELPSGIKIPRTHKVISIEGDPNEGRPDIFVVSSGIVTNPFMETLDDKGVPIRTLRTRANTADTFNIFGKLDTAKRVVAVTNAHFRPFQGVAAAKQLGELGIDSEVVGFDPSHFGKPRKQSHELVQEMLTTADSLAA